MPLPVSSYGISVSRLLIGVTAGITLFWLWTKSRRSYYKYNIPPFPVRPWPLVGHLFTVVGNFRDIIKELRVKGGDIYSLDLSGDLHILVHNFTDLKEIWVKHADIIMNTQHNLTDELLGEYNMGLFSARDDNWKEQKSTSLAILRSFGLGKNIMAVKVQEEVIVIIDKLAALNGRPEDIKVLLYISVANIICSLMVGKRFEHEDPYFIRLIEKLNIVMNNYIAVALLTPFKQLRYLPGDFFHTKKWTKAAKEVSEMFTKHYIRIIKKDLNDHDEPDNFVGAYLQEMKKLKDKGVATHLDEANLIATIRILFLAGTETTSATILWFVLYMLYYPHVQEKMHQEIETNIGTERLPNIGDKPKMTYVNAVIMETQRFASLAPVGIRREVSETFEHGGYTFPKGSILWPVLDSVHFDKKIWGDPENFRPERFIDKNGALVNREELIPFSIGKRVCLGESLAKMELFLFLSAMTQRFKMEPANPGELPTLKEILGATVIPQPFTVRFVERKV